MFASYDVDDMKRQIPKDYVASSRKFWEVQFLKDLLE